MLVTCSLLRGSFFFSPTKMLFYRGVGFLLGRAIDLVFTCDIYEPNGGKKKLNLPYLEFGACIVASRVSLCRSKLQPAFRPRGTTVR